MELPFIDLRHRALTTNQTTSQKPQLKYNTNLSYKNYASTTYITNTNDIILTNPIQINNELKLNLTKVTSYNHKVIQQTSINLSYYYKLNNFNGNVVDTKSFLCRDDDTLQISVCNELGNVLLFYFNYDSFVLEEFKVVYIVNSILGNDTTEKLSAIVWLSDTTVVLGISNRIVCVDVHTLQYKDWKIKEKTVMKRLSGAFFPPENEEDEMTSILALCYSNGIAFSLHVDGIIRVWYIPSIGVVTPSFKSKIDIMEYINITTSTWTDWCLESTVLDGSYTLAINIVSKQQPYQSRLLLINGRKEEYTCKILDIPEKGRGVLDMAFTDLSLQVIFSTNDSSLLVQYSFDPNASPKLITTIEEINQMTQLHFLSLNQFRNGGYNKSLKRIDSHFYKLIFKPAGVYSSFIMESSILEACTIYFPPSLLNKYSGDCAGNYILSLLHDYHQVTMVSDETSPEKLISPMGKRMKVRERNSFTTLQEDVQLEQYYKLWKEFITLVYKIQEKSRQPLLLTSFENSSYLLRVGSFSCIEIEDRMVLDVKVPVDKVHCRVMTAIENGSIHSIDKLSLEIEGIVHHTYSTIPQEQCNSINLPSYTNRNIEALSWWNHKFISFDHDILLSCSYLIQHTLLTLEKQSLSNYTLAPPEFKNDILQQYIKIKVVQWCFSQLDKRNENRTILDLFIRSQVGDVSYDSLDYAKEVHDTFIQYIFKPKDNASSLNHLKQISEYFPSIVLRMLLLIEPGDIMEFIQKVDLTAECLFRESMVVDEKDRLQSMAVVLNEGLMDTLKIKMKWSISNDVFELLPLKEELDQEEKVELGRRVQTLLFKESEMVMDSIRYFVELPSISKLLHGWLHDESAVYTKLEKYHPIPPKALFRDFILRLYTTSRSLQYLHYVTTFTNNYTLMLSTACKTMKTFKLALPNHIMQEYTSLCSFCLKYAIQTNDWQIGYGACVNHPLNPTKGIPQLVVSMVQAGALRDFLLLSKDLLEKEKEYYDVVGYALYDAYLKKKGLMFLEALYALHVYHGEWKKACKIMNIIYHLQVMEYGVKQGVRTGDIYLSAMACYHSICLEEDSQQYLISSKTLGDVKLGTKFDDGSSESHLYLPNDLLLRMMFALSLVYFEKDIKIGTLFYHDEDNSNILENVKKVVCVLAEKGCFGLAVLLARKASDKIMTNGVYDSLLQVILCGHLVPLAVILSRPTPVNADGREYESDLCNKAPSLSTLFAQLSSRDYTPFIRTDEWRPDTGTSKLKGLVCTKLLQEYLKTAPPSVVLDVSDKMIVLDEGMASLPAWLLQLFQPLNGSFASFPFNNPGNPTDLLRLYLRHGMYTTACKFVTTILSLPKKLGLPEKGEIEYVPYNDIDKLWKITSYCLNEYLYEDGVERREMIEAREGMKLALIGHIRHLKQSEVGRMSARILSRG